MLASSSKRLLLHRLPNQSARRGLQDLVPIPNRAPAIQHGPPGRSAVTGHVVTVFGCTGFLGRYLVSKLAKAGTQVIVPYRDEDEKRHLKVMGDLGQIVPLEWDIRNEPQIAECLRHSDMVYNLVGRNFETKNFDFHSIHAKGAEAIAKIAADNGVSRLVHVSHLNASTSSASKFYQTKAEGEARVMEAFPSATIVRPAVMFGYEDKLLNNMANWPIWWKLNHGQTHIRPVHVMDVAQALTNLLSLPVMGRTLNLPGPSTLTVEYLLDLISSVTYHPPSKAPTLPKPVALFLAKAAQSVWWPALSPDEVIRRYIDDVDVPGDWDVVGIVPAEVEAYAINYLRQYRSADNYTRPVVFPHRPVSNAAL
ncbi:NADH dehydrogenase [Rickenella mellea]|uniref:NADH dehydrogenase n=1 Tax=Rickenella mellea TaxID=50990 RepID=A0A4Y7Q734_9AGAM|nr:NADH dehydrogenase [Rickenella mellea]